MSRHIGVLAAITIGASALAAVPAVAQDTAIADAPPTSVRIQARKLEAGKVEFGLRLGGNRQWLPPARLFPYPTAEVGRWLFSSPYTMRDGALVRIQARLLADGRIEFGLQLDGEQVWLPRARYFPYDTAMVGAWLFSSPYSPPGEQGTPGDAPRNLRVVAVVCNDRSLHSVRLAWDPPRGADRSTITGYELSRLRVRQPDRRNHPIFEHWVSAWRHNPPEISDAGMPAVVSRTSFIDSDVFNLEVYEWSVRATSGAGRSAPAKVRMSYSTSYSHYRPGAREVYRSSCDGTARPPTDISAPDALLNPPVPGAPQDLSVERIGDWSDGVQDIDLSWSPPVDDGGDRVTHYQVLIFDSAGNYLEGVVFGAQRGRNVGSLGISAGTGLNPGEVFLVVLTAVNTYGDGEPAHFSLTATGSPQPTNLRL